MEITLLYLWKASAGQRVRIVLSCVVGILGVAFSLGFVWTSKQMVDIATGATTGCLWQMGIFTTILLILQLCCNIFDGWLSSRMQVEGGNILRRRVFAQLLQSRWNELERFHTGDVVNRVEQDCTSITTLLTNTLPSAIVTGVQLIASFVFFCMLDRALPWLLVGILPLFLIAARFYMKRMRRYTRDIRRSDSNIQSIIQESIQHRIVIKTLEQSVRYLEKLDNLQNTLRTQVNQRTRFSLFSRGMMALAFSGGYLLAFLWGVVRLSHGSITFGTMTAFLQLVGNIQRPVLELARMIPSGVTAITASERLMELEALAIEEEGDKVLFKKTPSIVLEGVTFAYPEQTDAVFNSFTLEFPAGKRIAVMGKTGRGKTTLLRLLLALTSPQEGCIYLTDGKNKEKVSPSTRCNFIYVPQGNTLFSGTIRDNLLMGKPDATIAEMREVLTMAVAEFVFDLPQGIDAPLGEQGTGLSEGQAQRIAIARALLRPGNVLLLDEATSALDTETEKVLVDNLMKTGNKKTVIFITHHPALADICDVVVRL